MLPHQERVVQEKRDLDDKIDKLRDFLHSAKFADVEAAEQGRLTRQYSLMGGYSRVLGERIAEFPS